MLIQEVFPGVFSLLPRQFGDARGMFSETFRQDVFDAQIGPWVFVQDNQSRSTAVGTLRGLHFQKNPNAQGKLVRCQRGVIWDIAVDIRRGSPTFGQHIAATLTAQGGEQLWIPPGFAHGFCTLEPDSEIAYKVTSYYSAPDDRGLAWDDPALGIDWPLQGREPVLSDKDRKQPLLADLDHDFVFA